MEQFLILHAAPAALSGIRHKAGSYVTEDKMSRATLSEANEAKPQDP